MLIELAKNSQVSFQAKELVVPELIHYAKRHLKSNGILKMTSDPIPYCYLKIEDSFVHQLFPLLPEVNICIPNYFNFTGAIGAHISVVYDEEVDQEKGMLIDEIGESFRFVPDCVYEVQAFNKRFIALIVQSPELERLRLKYGFPSKLNYHGLMVPFHITIAVGK